MKSKKLYLDIHVLQTVPSSCINRDDTGSPKTCIYGGVERSRVSSQAWKRAVRKAFEDMLPQESVGIRTKRIVGLVKEEILKLQPDMNPDQAEKTAIKALEKAKLKIKDAKVGTDAVFLIGQQQAKALAELILSEEKDTNKYTMALKQYPTVDMALFGRMVASDPSLNYDAVCQVAHAISTHEVETEYDYFTAVDDLSTDMGASHVGVAEFTSATLYRYADVNCKELYRTIGEQACEAVCAFVKAFILSMPTGKENSYANTTIPCSVYIALREDRPVSLVPAFEAPIKASSKGYEKASQKALVEYEKKTRQFVEEPVLEIVLGEGLDNLATPVVLNEALDILKKEINNLLPGGDE